MKKVDVSEFSDTKEVKGKIVDLKKELMSLRMQKSTGELADSSLISKVKRNIARLFTKLDSLSK